MTQKNILVLVHADAFTGVHHALALAKRVPARIFILRLESPRGEGAETVWLEEILTDLMASAKQSGVDISYHTTRDLAEGELEGFVEAQHINLLIVGEEGPWFKERLRDSLPDTSSRPFNIIEVKAKPPRG